MLFKKIRLLFFSLNLFPFATAQSTVHFKTIDAKTTKPLESVILNFLKQDNNFYPVRVTNLFLIRFFMYRTALLLTEKRRQCKAFYLHLFHFSFNNRFIFSIIKTSCCLHGEFIIIEMTGKSFCVRTFNIAQY